MSRQKLTIAESIIYEAAPIPNRANEDAYHVSHDANAVLIAVADGASQRLKTNSLLPLLKNEDKHVTLAGYAARLTTRTIANHRYWQPVDMLLAANFMLRQQLMRVWDDVTASAVLHHEPALQLLREDPRYVRLALPVCVVTVARIDLMTRTLHYAHAGDTALLVFYDDGRVISVTGDQIGPHDAQALSLARQILQESEMEHFSEVVRNHRVVEANRRNGIYHNFVDEKGNPDIKRGVGVINGLPQLSAYIQQGELSLEGVSGVLVCSDGFLWPAKWGETRDEMVNRLQSMRQLIELHGIDGYYRALRDEEKADATFDTYPRFKQHDDATGVYAKIL